MIVLCFLLIMCMMCSVLKMNDMCLLNMLVCCLSGFLKLIGLICWYVIDVLFGFLVMLSVFLILLVWVCDM